MIIRTVADLKAALNDYPDEMIVQGWNDDLGWFHDLQPEIWDASPAHIKLNGDDWDGYVDTLAMEIKENPSEEDLALPEDIRPFQNITRIGKDCKVLKI